MSERNWYELECTNCTGTLFIEPFSFIKHPTQGTSKKPYGVVCFTCGRNGDPEIMARKMELARREKELEELTAQQAALVAAREALDEQIWEEEPVVERDLVKKRAAATRKSKASSES